jgi:hypothetical protein
MLFVNIVVTIRVRTDCSVSNMCFATASSSLYTLSSSWYVILSSAERLTIATVPFLIVATVSIVGRSGSAGLSARLGSIYFYTPPLSAIVLTTNSHVSHYVGESRTTVFEDIMNIESCVEAVSFD